MSRVGLIVIGVVVLAFLAGLALLSGAAGGLRLDRSALGVEGLARLAPDLGLGIERPRRIAAQKASALSLRILPLYDMDLYATAAAPRTRAEDLGQTTLREIDGWVLEEKLAELPSLVVLPKWRGGVIVTGVAHPAFLIAAGDYAGLMGDLSLAGTRLRRGAGGFEEPDLSLGPDRARLALFFPQVFQRGSFPSHCTEVAGLAAGALVIRCPRGYGHAAMFLSDPDLLNTHGLTKGQNAAAVVALIRLLQAPGEARPVYLDTSTELLLAPEADEDAQYYDRDSDMLLRFFAWPLSLLWAAGGAVMAIAIWRGSVRFGPVRRVPEDRLEVSKRAAVAAKARLIRMSHNDGRMVAEFVQARLQALADQTFGPGLGEAGVARLQARLARRDPAAAAALGDLVARLAAGQGARSGPELRRSLDRFKDLLERLTHGSS